MAHGFKVVVSVAALTFVTKGCAPVSADVSGAFHAMAVLASVRA